MLSLLGFHLGSNAAARAILGTSGFILEKYSQHA